MANSSYASELPKGYSLAVNGNTLCAKYSTGLLLIVR